jgi:imidazole glycerol-phosphate synthase subunit HisH
MTTIIDYGVGNIGSIANMLKKVGEESVITSSLDQIEEAQKLILCGIGAFDDGMTKLAEMNLVPVLRRKVLEEKVPILGVCLGMQLFTHGSEEGNMPGLGFVEAQTRKFDFSIKSSGGRTLRIPHMGWNLVEQSKPSSLLSDMYPDPRFYFVHSYHVVMDDHQDVLLQSEYGFKFTAAFEHKNIIGVQFHPEKSHKFGIKLYENFVNNY